MRVAADCLGATHKGLVREENQDAWGFRDFSGNGRGVVLAVADGMGGHSGGQIASRLAVEFFFRAYLSAPGHSPSDWMERGFAWANQAVLDRAREQPDLAAMGTTLSVLSYSGNEFWAASAGDTRIYLLRQGAAHQVFQDDTVVNRLLAQGSITCQEAKTHPQRHVLTKVIGSQSFPGIAPLRIPAQPGDTLLACSDGLYNLVEPAEILLHTGEVTRQEGLDALVSLALQRGGDDNVTVAAISISKQASALTQATQNSTTIAIY